jgi:hypothetical protein
MNNSRPHLLGVLAGLFLAAGLVLAATLVTRAWLRIAESQTIAVTGSARKSVRSDLANWRGWFSVEASDLQAARQRLKDDLIKVEQFLKGRGITNYVVDSINVQELKTKGKSEDDPGQRTIGYRLTQSVALKSPDVDGAALLDREAGAALIEQGVLFSSSPAEYIYTKAGEAKVEMLAEATKDARARAEQIASQGGRGITQLRSARMGVFQITPLHSIQTSSEGMNDTSSLEKTITAVVSASFSMK